MKSTVVVAPWVLEFLECIAARDHITVEQAAVNIVTEHVIEHLRDRDSEEENE
jgi:hypothetical protein